MIPQAYPLFLVVVEAWDGEIGPEFDIHGPHRVIGWQQVGDEYQPVRLHEHGHGATDAYEEGVRYERHYFDTYDAARNAEESVLEAACRQQQIRKQRLEEARAA
jgi:hypothetical protein